MKQPQAIATSPSIRLRLLVTGVVQGVGFRPFVYDLAKRHGLSGFVGNNSEGVFIEIEGRATAVHDFCAHLKSETPPVAHIDSLSSTTMPAVGSIDFAIVQSQALPAANTLIAPDISICADCQRELLDPQNRRYGYPFINCTHCGPRFTIIKDIPYDRPYTTMAGFMMCPDCQAEYDDPLNRRFHAQPNACAACGPHVWLETADNNHHPANGQDPILATQTALQQGKIVAIKGIGGFHLACAAENEAALHRLRERKGRVDKPLAVMARDMAIIRQFAYVSAAEESLLAARERPIVLLRKKAESSLSPLVAPGQNSIGVMLPYSPLHILLFQAQAGSRPPASVLVMTSANYSNEPIVMGNEEARTRLSGLADAFLMHNREIYGRCDDSVMRVVRYPSSPSVASASENNLLLPIRRSRGYAPFPVKLPFSLPPTLAVGGELKATFCLTKDRFAYMSQHIGDMENLETLAAWETAVAHFQAIFRIEPELVACDQHPLYLSKQWAEKQTWPVVAVQHHHAHIASVMAEHQLSGDRPVIGFSFDGTGYGTDGAIWGGELLLADYSGFNRLAHLNYVPLAGGDAAVKRPYRLALASLWQAGLDWDDALPAVQACPQVEQQVLRQQLEKGLNVVPCSSMGRLFDAVASLIGVRQTITYEGQAAIELEAVAADNDLGVSYEFDIANEGIIETMPLLQAIVADVKESVATAVISAKFHNAVANLIVQLSLRCREQTGLNQVALSGGVFQNVRLLETAVRGLKQHHFEPLTHCLLPPNDGGLALGQAVIANRQRR